MWILTNIIIMFCNICLSPCLCVSSKRRATIFRPVRQTVTKNTNSAIKKSSFIYVLGDYQNNERCLSVFPSTSQGYFVRTRYRLSLVVFRFCYAFGKNIHWGIFLDFPKLLIYKFSQKNPIFGHSFILMGLYGGDLRCFPIDSVLLGIQTEHDTLEMN